MQNQRAPQRSVVRIGLVDLIRRRALPGLLALALGLGVGAAAGALLTPTYRSTTSVLVEPTGLPTSTSGDSLPHTEPPLNLETESQVMLSQEIGGAAAKAVDDKRPLPQVLENVSVSIPANTTVLNVTAHSVNAAAAQKLSRAFAQSYLDARRSSAEDAVKSDLAALEKQLDSLNKQLSSVSKKIAGSSGDDGDQAYAQAQQRILIDQVGSASDSLNRLTATQITGGSILADASDPVGQTVPLKLLALVAGGVLGLVGALALMLLLERRDRTVRRSEEVEAAGVPVIGVRPERGDHGRGASRGMIDPWAALRNDIEATFSDEVTVLLTVPVGGAATSARATAHLAEAFARTGREVAVVCADFSSPDLAQSLGVPSASSPGLIESLARKTTVGVFPSPTVEGVFVLPPGPPAANSADLLHSREFAHLCDDLRASFDLIIVQALPSEAITVARAVDRTVLLVELGVSRYDDIESVVSQVVRAGGQVVGAVVLDARRLVSDLSPTGAPARPGPEAHVAPVSRPPAPPVSSAPSAPSAPTSAPQTTPIALGRPPSAPAVPSTTSGATSSPSAP